VNKEVNHKSKNGKTVHIISNTHWDRAWVYPFQETRLLLLEFMDDLLDLLENDPKFHSFLLDSQTIAVEDYLDIRPEKEKQIKKFVKNGKLIVGPWYNLPEEYIVNGESLVRNMVVGHRQAEALGKVSKIGYTPFSYGQTSQMPQLYRGFDIDTIIFYRGINTKKSEFILEGPDGSRLLGCRFGALSRFSYYFYVYRMARFGMSRDEWWYDWDRGTLPFRMNNENHPHDHYYPLDVTQEKFDKSVLPKQLKKLIDEESEHFSTSQIACMQGFDCSSPDPYESGLVEDCQPIAREMGHEIKLSSLEDFMNAMRKEVKDPEVITGESRNPGATGKWTNLMGDVLSSRTKIKRRNAQSETALQRLAEPFSTLGWIVGGEYMKATLDLSWKYMLQNHPHDNICGAGIDQMEKDMMYRFDQSEIISNGVTRRALSSIQKRINNNNIDIKESVITVFNPSPFVRSEVISLSVDLPDKSDYKGMSIREVNGEAIPYTETGRESFGTLVRNLQDISLQLRSQRLNIHAEFKDIPAYGYKTFHLKRESSDVEKRPVTTEQMLPSPQLENEHLKILIKSNGSLDILDKKTGHWFENQHYFEESGESGNPWIHMFPEKNQIFTTIETEAEITHVESSEFLTRYIIRHTMEVPDGLEGEEGNYRRSETMAEMVITSVITLRKGQKWLDIHTSIDNQIEQHRVRACFPTGLMVENSAAEAAFDVIERPIIRTADSLYFGKENPQYPMHRFVDMSDGNKGLAIFNDGIREYEAVDDDKRTVAITLFRGFTATQSPVIDQWDVYPWMKLSQSLGLNEWRYAIMPHAGNWKEGKVYREVDKFQLPLETAQAGKGGKDLPKSLSFMAIKSDEIIVSAFKKHEKRESFVLRLFNPTDDEIKTQVTFSSPIKKAWLTNMNEEQREEINRHDQRSIELVFQHKKILTVEVDVEKI
jgi:alpha-mannosidase